MSDEVSVWLDGVAAGMAPAEARFNHDDDSLGAEVPWDRGRLADVVRGSSTDDDDASVDSFVEMASKDDGPVDACEVDAVAGAVDEDSPDGYSRDIGFSVPTFSANRTVRAPTTETRLSTFPITNTHEPHEAVPLPTTTVPVARPKSIRDAFTGDWVRRITRWLEKAKAYELAGRQPSGRPPTRPPDLLVPPDALKRPFRGHAWWFVDYLQSGGAKPIITVDEAVWTSPTLSAEAAREFGALFGDESVTDRLVNGHRDFSTCEHVTLLSVNHRGALKFWQALEKSFVEESAVEVGWLLGPLDFIPCFPCRIEPCNGVDQGTKVRVTTDKSWPKPGMTPVSSVNDGIDLDALGVVKFGKVVDFAKAIAVLNTLDGDDAGDARLDQRAFAWKVDLTAAYRQLHVHPSCVWNRAKSWLGKVYIDVRAQFGDAGQVKAFQDITDLIVSIARMATAGSAAARAACDFMTPADWDDLDSRRDGYEAWSERRRAAGLSGDDLIPCFIMGYIDDFLGAASTERTATAQCRLVRGICLKLGFPLKEEKTTWPERRIEALGADLDLETEVVRLAQSKIVKYAATVATCSQHRSISVKVLRELVAKLVYAAQFTPVGRAWLVCGFTALGQGLRHGKRKVRIGAGLRRELIWWADALYASPGVAFAPKTVMNAGEAVEYFFDASTSWGVGGACVYGDTCYWWQHKWRGAEPWHINVGENFGGYGSLRLFSAVIPSPCFLEMGDNMVANATARRGSTPNRRIAEIARERGLFVLRRGLATQQEYVNTLDNKMADPLSRGDDAETLKAFEAAARDRGAVRFVRLAVDAHMLDLERRVGEIGHDGDQEPIEIDISVEVVSVGEATSAVVDDCGDESADEVDEPASVDGAPMRFGHMSGFAGMDSTAAAVAELGGVPTGAFDSDATVRRVWQALHGRRCWGNFYDVYKFVRRRRQFVTDQVHQTLLYTAGTPCPDWSTAGKQRGRSGNAGGKLWLHNISFVLFCMFPVVILEQVPGILDVDNGAALREAVDRLRDAGYLVRWRVRRCNRTGGDATSRRRIFVVAILPRMLREGVTVDDFFEPELEVRKTKVVDIVDVEEELDPSLIYDGPVEWMDRVESDEDYDGPVLLGRIGEGGIGMHVYCAMGPAITQKTWGEGYGRSTGLYRFPDGTVRRLSTREAMRAHSFPARVVSQVHDLGLESEELYRLVGNSIPVKTMRSLVENILSLLDPSQIPTIQTTTM